MLPQIVLLIILIWFNGIFASAELAFLSVDKYKIKENAKKGNKKAKKIEKLISEPSKFLATIQIGITLAGFLASAFAADSFAEVIVQNPIFKYIDYGIAKTIVVVIVTIVLSYFTLIFGELVPKRVALAHSESIAYKTVNLITILMKGATPFVWILTKSTNLVSKMFGIESKEEEKMTEEEIKKIIITGREEGAIESGEKKLIFNIFEFNDTPVKKAMTKRNNMVMIDINADKKDILKTIKESKYTRLPIYENDKDNVIGILNIKTLLLHYHKNSAINLKEIMYSPTFVTPDEKLDDVFRMMQKNRKAISIVKKGHEVIGLLTLEDAIEEVLGNIYDEFDEKNDKERQNKNQKKE